MIPRILGPLVRRERAVEGLRELGAGAEIQVQPGQAVQPDTIIGSTKTGSRVVRLPLDQGDLTLSMILKRAGESVRRGEPLLRRASLFGLANTEFLCPVDGYIEEILVPQRAVLIREHTAEVRAGVVGSVSGIINVRGVSLRFDGTVIRLFAGWGPPVAGILTEPLELFSPADVARYLNESHRGKIIWASSTLCAEAILEAARIEAVGILAGSVSLLELQRASHEVRQRTGRTGLPLTLVISERFGSAPMSSDYRRHLVTAVEQTVYLDPGTDAGYNWMRDPEITYSPGPTGLASSVSLETQAYTSSPTELAPGLPVRLVDLDVFGRQGTLAGPPKKVALETGVEVEAVQVVLEEGIQVLVPVQNVEIIAAGPEATRR